MTLKSSAKKAQAIIVSSKLEYEDALEFGIPKDKIHIIPMGINIDENPIEKTQDEISSCVFSIGFSSIFIPMGMIWILSLGIPNSNASSYSSLEETIIACAFFADDFNVIKS